MATKNISLNISERISALSLLQQFKGNLDKVAVILEDIKQFTMEKADWAQCEMYYINTAGEKFYDEESWTANQNSLPEEKRGGSMKWDDEKGGLKEMWLQEVTADYLRSSIKEKEEKGEFTLQDRGFISLKTKLI